MATSKINNKDLVEILKNSGDIIKQDHRRDNPYMIVRYCGKLFRITNPYSSKARATEVKDYAESKESFLHIKDL